MWGRKGTPEFLAKSPADLTPLLEEAGLPRGSIWESCAIMQYLCSKHGLLSSIHDPGERAMVDSAMFYLTGTFYPLLTRATIRRSASASTPGRSGRRADDENEGQGAEGCGGGARYATRAIPRLVPRGRKFIGGDGPSIADMRWAATPRFLRAIDYELPGWAEEYIERMNRPWERRTPSQRGTCVGTSRT